jgi:hypothetical protein
MKSPISILVNTVLLLGIPSLLCFWVGAYYHNKTLQLVGLWVGGIAVVISFLPLGIAIAFRIAEKLKRK